jgi:hypothetical protein
MNKDRAFNELYSLARNCAEYNHRGCNCQCGQCEYNIYLYTNERDATLIKANAFANYQKLIELEQKSKMENLGQFLAPFIVIAIIVCLLMWCCK